MPGDEARAAAAAFAFLTRVPIARAVELDGGDLARGAPAFPVVGAVVGTAVGGTATLLVDPLGAALAGALALALGVALTGAMHQDALADTADALGASSRERALEIMRDPRLGSFGASALALALLVQAAALGALAGAGNMGLVVASFALARGMAPALAAALPDARRGTGLGGSLAAGGAARAMLAAAIAVGAAVALAGLGGLALACAALGTAMMTGWISHRRFGGVTGDTLGAAIALTEVACLCVAVALVQHSAG